MFKNKVLLDGNHISRIFAKGNVTYKVTQLTMDQLVISPNTLSKIN